MDARACSDILERAVTSIAVEEVAMYAGDEEVDVAVVIEVGGSGAHAEGFALESGFFRDILEAPLAQIAIQVIPPGRIGLGQGGLLGAVGQEKVDETVIIEIEGCDAARHGLDLMLLRRGAVAEDGCECALGRNVIEADRKRVGAERCCSEEEEDAPATHTEV